MGLEDPNHMHNCWEYMFPSIQSFEFLLFHPNENTLRVFWEQNKAKNELLSLCISPFVHKCIYPYMDEGIASCVFVLSSFKGRTDNKAHFWTKAGIQN